MQRIPKYSRFRRRIYEAIDLGVISSIRRIRLGLRRSTVDGVPNFPPVVSVELTDHCNLACPSCPQPQMTGEKDYMSEELFRKIVDECCDYPSFTSLVMTGFGEPLLHPKICSLSRYAKNKGIPTVRTYTNAKVLRDVQIDDLILRSGLDEITLSLNGPTAETYARIKGSDGFERVTNHIKQFLKRKRELKRIKPFVNLHLLAITDHTYDIDNFSKEWKPLLGPGDCLALKPSHNFAGQVNETGYGLLDDGSDRSACGQLWSYLFVARTGEVSPCCVDPFKKLVIGNVIDSTLEQLWQSSVLNRMREFHQSGHYEKLPLCTNCQTWRYFTINRANLWGRIKQIWV